MENKMPKSKVYDNAKSKITVGDYTFDASIRYTEKEYFFCSENSAILNESPVIGKLELIVDLESCIGLLNQSCVNGFTGLVVECDCGDLILKSKTKTITGLSILQLNNAIIVYIFGLIVDENGISPVDTIDVLFPNELEPDEYRNA